MCYSVRKQIGPHCTKSSDAFKGPAKIGIILIIGNDYLQFSTFRKFLLSLHQGGGIVPADVGLVDFSQVGRDIAAGAGATAVGGIEQ